MPSIDKAYYSLEKKEIKVDEYKSFLATNPNLESLKALFCVECGDLLTYCDGEHNIPYFRHSPTHEGHGYCSLYQQGTCSNTNEALIRKKLFRERDITLNYELRYVNGEFGSYITLPPFTKEDISQNGKNNTIIYIGKYCVKLDSSHFFPGEIKFIKLPNLSHEVDIRIKGNSTKENISYKMDGFKPEFQIYSSLILQNYVFSNAGSIDLQKIRSFTCKRVSGHIYTGRHYFIFSQNNPFIGFNHTSGTIDVRVINFPRNFNFPYTVFDVVFNEITPESEKFCTIRECNLVRQSDAIIIWPPVISSGNYRLYREKSTNEKMFISFENKGRSLGLCSYNLNKLFFKIDNINSGPFYVSRDNRPKDKTNYLEKIYVDNLNELSPNKVVSGYIFKKNVVFASGTEAELKSKRESFIYISSPLERYMESQSINDNTKFISKLKSAIWFTKKFVNFKPNEYNYLCNKYNVPFIKDYIEMCKIKKVIKLQALNMLMEGR